MGFTKSSKIQELFWLNLNSKQDLRIQKIEISISSDIQESERQNLIRKQDSNFSCQGEQNSTAEINYT